MRDVTDEVRDYLAANFVPQTVEIVAYVDEDNFDIVTIPQSRIVQNSMRINWATSLNDELRFGTAIAPDLVFKVDNADGLFSSTLFKGEKLRVYCDVTVDGTLTTFNLGGFYVESIATEGNNISIKALGLIVKLDKIYNTGDIQFPITTFDFASELCTLCGLQLKEYQVDDELRNTNIMLEAEPESGKYTCRQLLAYVCEIMGGLATTSMNNGTEKIWVHWFQPRNAALRKSNAFSFVYDPNYGFPTGVKIITQNTSVLSGTDDFVYVIQNNPLLSGVDAVTLEGIADQILMQARIIEICPFEAEAIPMPYIETVDAIRCNFDVFFWGMVSQLTWEPNRNIKLKGVTFKKQEYDTASPFTPQQDAVIDNLSKETGQDITELQSNVADLTDATESLSADVDDLQTTAETLSYDYIVESGIDGIWQWRKWKSGIAECWGVSVCSIPANGMSTLGSLFSFDGQEAFPEGLFVSIPVQELAPQRGTRSFWVGLRNTAVSTSSAAYAIITTSNSANAHTVRVGIHAVGRWQMEA